MTFRAVRLLAGAGGFALLLAVGAGCGGKSTSLAAEAGGARQCDDFANAMDQWVRVGIVNKTQSSVYLGPREHGCSQPNFAVTDEDGAPIPVQDSCHTCQDFVEGATTPCFPILCPVASVITLQPGEGVMERWNAVYAADETLPGACAFSGESTSCQQRLRIQPGIFNFSVQVGTAMDCSQFASGTCPDCTGNGDGGCYTAGALISGPLLSSSTKVLLDESYGVGNLTDCTGNECIARSVVIDVTD